MSTHADSKSQPAPTGTGASVTDAVIADLQLRREHGTAKYGTELRAHNGRDAEVDLYQELLDAVMYQKQRLMERADTGNLAGRWMEAALKLAPASAATIAFDPMHPEAWLAAIIAKRDGRTLDELAGDAVAAIGAVFHHIEDRTAATKQLRDLADYAESCIESLDRR